MAQQYNKRYSHFQNLHEVFVITVWSLYRLGYTWSYHTSITIWFCIHFSVYTLHNLILQVY